MKLMNHLIILQERKSGLRQIFYPCTAGTVTWSKSHCLPLPAIPQGSNIWQKWSPVLKHLHIVLKLPQTRMNFHKITET